MQTLIEQLAEGNFGERTAAAEELAQLGRPAVDPLLKMLDHTEWFVRRLAAEALGKIGDPAAIDGLIELLDDNNDPVVADALKALRKIGKTKGEEKLLETYLAAAAAGKYRVREEAGDTLIELAPQTRFDLAEMIRSDVLVRENARVLAKWGDEGVELLNNLYEELPTKQRTALLRGIGDSKSPALLELMSKFLYREEDPAALKSIGYYFQGVDSTETAPTLIEALDYPNPDVRSVSCRALAERRIIEAAPSIRKLLDHREIHVVREAALALGKMGDTDAIPLLLALLENPEHRIRSVAARALGRIGDDQAVDPLLQALESDNIWHVRAAAARALGNFNRPKVIGALTRALDDREGFVADKAARALQKIGDNAAAAIPELHNLALHAEGNKRSSAIDALGRIGSNDSIPILVEFLDDEHLRFRDDADRSLNRLVERGLEFDDISRLEEIVLSSQWEDARWRSAYLLGAIGDRKAVDSLLQALDDESIRVRTAAIYSLGNLGDPKSIEKLATFLGDQEFATWGEGTKDDTLSEHARRAIAAIGGSEAERILSDWKSS